MPEIAPAKGEATDTVAEVLLQVPPGAALLREVVIPSHTWLMPVMAGGIALTVSTAAVLQPAPRE